MSIDPFKARVIALALHAVAPHGFALAGGNALAAHGLLTRPTQDIDLFTPVAGATGQVLDAVRTALAAHGYAVHVLRAADDGDFAELHVSRDGETTQLHAGPRLACARRRPARRRPGAASRRPSRVEDHSAARPRAAARLHRRRRR
jgi:hypothetical protein